MKGLAVVGVVLGLGACSGEPETNHPPFLVSSFPDEGQVIVVAPGGDRELAVTLADENVGDDLFIRYLVDYPGSGEARHLLRSMQMPPNGAVERAPVRILLTCSALFADPAPTRILLSVADRPFLSAFEGQSVDPDAPLDSVQQPGIRLRAIWLLNMNCR
jgi:hypothetical protein